jgi:Holliday junction DNA helicase RuvA
MIAQLTGSIRSISTDRIILEVAGVGYLIHVTPTTSATLTLGNSLTVHTSMVVREDSMTLYGFIDPSSRETFELVQTVSGIGPRVALSILAHLSPDQLADAVESESVAILSGVPGIGKKGAQRILLELKGKLARTGLPGAPISSSQPIWREQLSGALISLGYSAREADSTISIVAIDYANRGLDPAHSDLSDLLKAALAGGKS